MRIFSPSEKSMREVEEASAAVPEPDRVTLSGKRIWYTGRERDAGAGVYFIGAMGADLVKIGWVRHLEKLDDRIERMRIDCPYPVMPLFSIGPATRVHEGRVHKHFIDLRFHGEWFRYDGALRELLDLAQRDEDAARDALARIIDVKFDGA